MNKTNESNNVPRVIVDAHVHVSSDGGWFGTAVDASLDRLRKELADGPVASCVILPVNSCISNDAAARLGEEDGRLIPFGELRLSSGGEAEKSFREIVDLGLKGVKINPKFGNPDLNGNKYRATFEAIAERGLPLVIDGFPSYERIAERNFPYDIGRLAKTHPRLNVILAHAGGSKAMDVLLLMKAFPNIYADISYSLAYYEGSSVIQDMQFLVKKVGAGRIIYGSDFPEREMNDYFRRCDSFLSFLTAEEKEMVYSSNILALIAQGAE